MLSAVSTSKAWPLVAMLIAGMAVVVLVGCQVHPDSHDQMQASPAGHHRASSSHTTLDHLCVVAVLPLGVILAPVVLVIPYAMELLWHPNEFASPPFIPPRHVRVAVGGNRRPRWVVTDYSKEDKHMFRKLSQRRRLVLMTGMMLGLALVGCASTGSQQPSVQPGRFTVSQPLVMTCSEATYHSYSGQAANGITGRYVCREVKGPDGKALADLRLLDTRVGDKVKCTDTEGKITCPSESLAALRRSSPWTFATPGFVYPPVGAAGQ
jgi:hypothetical protein